MQFTNRIIILTFIICLLLPDGPAEAGEDTLPDGGRDLLPDWSTVDHTFNPEFASGQWRTVEGLPFDRVLRVTVKNPPEKPYHLQLSQIVRDRIQKEDVLHLRFWARTVSRPGQRNRGKIGARVEKASKPWTGLLSTAYKPGSSWKRYDRPFVAKQGFDPEGAQVNLRLGYFPQTVEIAGLHLIRFDSNRVDPQSLPRTKRTYPGMAPDASWRKAAKKRIQTHRKATLTAKVTGANGNPISNGQVNVQMTRHQFAFGSALHPKYLLADTKNGRAYRKRAAKYFNRTTFETGFRWHNWWTARKEGKLKEHKKRLNRMIQWCRRHDLSIRGHYLGWAPLQPDKSWKTPRNYENHPNKLWPDLKAHIQRKLKFAGGRMAEWDAVNHIIGWGPTYASVTGGPDIYADIIKLGRRMTDSEMWLNEGNIIAGHDRKTEYLEMIDILKKHGAKPDGVGFMGHFRGKDLAGPSTLLETFDQFAQKGVKLQITELDVDLGTNNQLEARYLRDVMTTAFSHPAMEGIVLWGFWEGRHWRPDAALWETDWSINPAGRSWKKLVFDRWWTETEGQTKHDGTFSTSGFLGTYTVTARAGSMKTSKTVHLKNDGTTVQLKLSE